MVCNLLLFLFHISLRLRNVKRTFIIDSNMSWLAIIICFCGISISSEYIAVAIFCYADKACLHSKILKLFDWHCVFSAEPVLLRRTRAGSNKVWKCKQYFLFIFFNQFQIPHFLPQINLIYPSIPSESRKFCHV